MSPSMWRCRGWWLLSALALTACHTPAPPSPDGALLSHRVLHVGAQCGSESPSIRPVVDAPALAALVQGGRAVIGGSPPEVSVAWSEQAVFVLSMGRQASAGSRLAVHSVSLDAAAQHLVVQAEWLPPEPGRVHAAVVTQPCVVFGVPRGHYRAVTVRDLQGQDKLQSAL